MNNNQFFFYSFPKIATKDNLNENKNREIRKVKTTNRGGIKMSLISRFLLIFITYQSSYGTFN